MAGMNKPVSGAVPHDTPEPGQRGAAVGGATPPKAAAAQGIYGSIGERLRLPLIHRGMHDTSRHSTSRHDTTILGITLPCGLSLACMNAHALLHLHPVLPWIAMAAPMSWRHQLISPCVWFCCM